MRLLPRLAAVAWLVGAAACGSGSPAPTTPPAGSPPPARERVYVTNETAGTVAIVDPVTGTVEATIPVGQRPRGLRVSRDGRQVFVALSGSPIAPPGVDESTLPPADRTKDGIGVLDLATRTVVRKIDSGQDPEAFDLSPDGRWMYVSNEETAEMSVVDLSLGTVVRRVPVGEEPEGVTVSPDGKVVYVTCEGDNTVVAVDTATYAPLARIKVGPRPRAIAIPPDGRTLFVTSETSASISVVDGNTHAVTATVTLPVDPNAPMPPRPMGAVLSPDGTRVYVSNGRGRSVVELDVTTRQRLRTFANVGERPWGIGVSADGRRLYTANGPSGDVSILDVASGTVARKVTLGGSPWGIAVASAP